MVKLRVTPEAKASDWAMRENPGRRAISSKRKLKEKLDPGQGAIGYSLGTTADAVLAPARYR